MKVVALIPARAGSKRIAGKNTRPLAGIPLITWSIGGALEAGCFHRVIVSTEDETIADLARESGAEVPWIRPPHLATDTATAVEVARHVVSQLTGERDPPDALMLLQPTSPFRTTASIRRAIEIFQLSGGESVVSVSPAKTHPYWCKRVTLGGVLEPFLPAAPALQSQDLPPVYQLNGLIYLASVSRLMAGQGFYSDATRALIIGSPEEAIDIDTPLDWSLAEAVAAAKPALRPGAA